MLTDSGDVDYEPAGYGKVRNRKGTPCENSSVAAGYLGVRVYVSRGDGTICGNKPFTYNPTRTAEFEAGILAGCPDAASRRAVAWGRIWQFNQQQYIEADTYAITPYL